MRIGRQIAEMMACLQNLVTENDIQVGGETVQGHSGHILTLKACVRFPKHRFFFFSFYIMVHNSSKVAAMKYQ